MLKPQDIAVLLKVACSPVAPPTTYERLGSETGISTTEAFRSLKRCAEAGLYLPHARTVARPQLLELLVHSVKYFFPVRLGASVRGIPTGFTAPVVAADGPELARGGWVWPDEEGRVRGDRISPLYPALPRVAPSDPAFYALLCLVDSIRAGGARERGLAVAELERRLAR